MRMAWIPAVLAACSAGLGTASFGVRSDRRIDARLRMLAAPSAGRDPAAGLWATLGRSGIGACFAPRPSVHDLEEGAAGVTADQVAGVRLLTVPGSLGLAVLLGLLWPPAAVVVACLLPVAWRLPTVAVRRRAAARRAAIDRHVLELAELLLAAIEAGLPPATAVERSAGLLHGPMGTEIDRVGSEIALGLDWRAALDQSAARTESESMATLAAALGRAHRLGTSPRAALRTIATELRAERRARAEELARRAPVKMLFPLVLLILPAFLLLTVGPVLLATLRSLH
jgi:Flp pilus assembly protein TadB